MKTGIIKLTAVCLVVFLSILAPAQSGGTYEITQSVTASGGGQQSAGGSFSLDGTIGQPAAGNAMNGPPFAVTSGFWNFTPLGPTAASVTVSGRVLSADGRGLTNAMVSVTDQNGVTRYARTSSFGYYRFHEVTVGETFVFTVISKRYTFAPQVVNVTGELTTLNFVAIV